VLLSTWCESTQLLRLPVVITMWWIQLLHVCSCTQHLCVHTCCVSLQALRNKCNKPEVQDAKMRVSDDTADVNGPDRPAVYSSSRHVQGKAQPPAFTAKQVRD
jgi:hypothetical protein